MKVLLIIFRKQKESKKVNFFYLCRKGFGRIDEVIRRMKNGNEEK